VTGYSPEDYAADPYLWIRMVHPDDRDTVRGHVDRILKGEEVSVLEHRIVHRDGTVRWLRDRIIGRRDDAGRLVGYEGLVEDVTRERELTSRLQERDIELRAARKTQERFLPSAPPVVPGLDVFGASYTRGFSGGDLFDYLAMPGQSLGFVIGDVTGHELGSALLMTSTCTTLRLLADTEPDVGEILKRTNRSLLDEASGQFVTLLLARLDPDKRQLVYVNAGHPAGWVLDAAGHVKASLESTAVPLGVLSDNRFPSAPPVDLEPGDTVLLLTDGLPEAVSPNGELFGIDRTMEVLRALRDRPAREIVESLYESVCRFCSPGQPADDVTLVVIKVG
jgi:sigma-B regulation protein RsbU (phosphoserine phosphatase)